ncbi:MAG: DUF393 domain-containing protein [Roseitalea sp.]|jgi:predicted DCC family thiol-disulfide oxidoreductase YuxK|nr:DUF393 domain-containing protein [Roseitalea sp.]MBO6721971.1 DUF393 domain-containing protein [Roseitalea sp.]MBO6743409.1 DUF393 domain-containing protein [Roseitalea sp.]
MANIDQTSDIESPAVSPAIDVFYDGGCPICRLEVGYYSRIDRAGAVRWIDIEALDDGDLPAGKTRNALLGRFHVRDLADGRWHVGVDAFARIWRVLPVWRHFAFVFAVPGLRQVAEIGYRGFLRWQRWHRARRAR